MVFVIYPVTVLYLKGLCNDNTDLYDLQYYVHGLRNDRPYFRYEECCILMCFDTLLLFRGFSKSHIYYDKTTSKWIIHSLVRANFWITTEDKWHKQIPIGTHPWQVSVENAVCKYPKDKLTEMTLTTCYPNKYTCNSGHCIPLSDKCDTNIDCADKSGKWLLSSGSTL